MKKYICGVVTGVVIASIIGVGAAGIWDNISVLRNDINVVVNGENVSADNFISRHNLSAAPRRKRSTR